MAKEVMLDDGRVALFDDTATEEEISKKLKDQGLKRQSGAVSPQRDNPNLLVPPGMGPVMPFIGSAINSAMFGLPEMGARALGAGPFIESVRRDYPVATTAGDVTGLAVPGALGVKAGQKALSSAVNTPQATFDTLRSGLASTGRRLAERAGSAAGGIMGAQTGAAALGGARSENYGAGAQQGAQVFRQAATNMPGMQLVPGAQPVMNAVTNVVPSLLGGGAAMTDYLSIDEMIRQEAARRALQGPK